MRTKVSILYELQVFVVLARQSVRVLIEINDGKLALVLILFFEKLRINKKLFFFEESMFTWNVFLSREVLTLYSVVNIMCREICNFFFASLGLIV